MNEINKEDDISKFLDKDNLENNPMKKILEDNPIKRFARACIELHRLAKPDAKAGIVGTQFEYDYMSLPNLLDLAHQILGKHRIFAFQTININDNNQNMIVTEVRDLDTGKLLFPASEFLLHRIEDEPKRINKSGKETTPNYNQNTGSSITHYRRYALYTVLGIMPDKDKDGN